MNKKVTIRDVAREAGVSISSVHFALSGKSGVSEETRSRIRETADRLGYQPNQLASSLKRRTQRLVIVLPSAEGNNRFYYPQVWQGIDDYLSTANMNLDYTRMPYDDSEKSRQEIFGSLRTMIRDKMVDGILLMGHVDRRCISDDDWKMIRDNDIAVVFTGSVNRHCLNYLCCVQPDYEIIGRTMAELIISHIPSFGSIFLCAGNPEWEQHAHVVKGFLAYLEENSCTNKVYQNHARTAEENNYITVLQELSRPDIAACCSVFSQGTILLGQALSESRKSSIFAVGSDLSEEITKWMRKRVLDNVIQKNPYAQSYVAIRSLVDYLVGGKVPDQKIIYVGSEVVFRSNLEMYEHGRYRYLFY